MDACDIIVFAMDDLTKYRLKRLKSDIEELENLPVCLPAVREGLKYIKRKLISGVDGKGIILLERLFRYLLKGCGTDVPWALKAYLEEECGIKPIVSVYDGLRPTFYPVKDFFLVLLPGCFLEEPLIYPYLYSLYLRWRGYDILSADTDSFLKYGEAYRFALREALFPGGESRLSSIQHLEAPVFDRVGLAVSLLRDSLPPIDFSLPEIFNAGWKIIMDGAERKEINELILTTLKLRAFRKEWRRFQDVGDSISGDN